MVWFVCAIVLGLMGLFWVLMSLMLVAAVFRRAGRARSSGVLAVMRLGIDGSRQARG